MAMATRNRRLPAAAIERICANPGALARSGRNQAMLLAAA